MSKRLNGYIPVLVGLFFTGATYLSPPPVLAAGQSSSSPASSSSSGNAVTPEVQRAKSELERTERFVADGTLPRVKLEEARSHLDDAEDEAVLKRTLYGLRTAGSMTEEEGNEMLAAAQRRVERARTAFEERERLLASGAIARVDLESASRELDDRKRDLGFAEDRLRLLKELTAMAETERQLTRSNTLQNSMIRSDGNGVFSLGDLTPIQAQFEKKFHRPLPISALGQTLTHQSLGLDHRNRVDVALSPSQPEGIWLLALLDRLHVPYLAFRSAVAGAATAPHIHIGLGSTRLQTDFRPSSHSVYSRNVR